MNVCLFDPVFINKGSKKRAKFSIQRRICLSDWMKQRSAERERESLCRSRVCSSFSARFRREAECIKSRVNFAQSTGCLRRKTTDTTSKNSPKAMNWIQNPFICQRPKRSEALSLKASSLYAFVSECPSVPRRIFHAEFHWLNETNPKQSKKKVFWKRSRTKNCFGFGRLEISFQNIRTGVASIRSNTSTIHNNSPMKWLWEERKNLPGHWTLESRRYEGLVGLEAAAKTLPGDEVLVKVRTAESEEWIPLKTIPTSDYIVSFPKIR